MNKIIVFHFDNVDKDGNPIKERYALNIDKVDDILVYKEATRMPFEPKGIEALSNVRGSVIPIVDLGKKMGYNVVKKNSKVIIARVQDEPIGFVVQGVDEIVEYSKSDESNVPEDSKYGIKVIRVYFDGASVKENANRDYVLATLIDTEKIMSYDENIAEGGRDNE